MTDPDSYPDFPPTKYPWREAATMMIAVLLFVGAIGWGLSVLLKELTS
jgi:hypothetical protein